MAGLAGAKVLLVDMIMMPTGPCIAKGMQTVRATAGAHTRFRIHPVAMAGHASADVSGLLLKRFVLQVVVGCGTGKNRMRGSMTGRTLQAAMVGRVAIERAPGQRGVGIGGEALI